MATEPNGGSGQVAVIADIKDRIREFIVSTLLQGEESIDLTERTPLVSSGIVDSLTSLEIGVFIEETFKIQISPAELVNPECMETIDSIARLIAAKLGLELTA